MDTTFIIYAAVALFAYGLISKRLASTPISGPMVFVGLGVAAYASGLVEPIPVVGSGTADVLELTLALLLFTDATKTHVRGGAPTWTSRRDS